MKIGLWIVSAAAVAAAAASILFLSEYGKTGHTGSAEITLNKSDVFSDAETEAAVNAVLDYFTEQSLFRGCSLQSLRYENGKTAGGAYTEPDYITLYSDFYACRFVCDESIGGKQTGWDWVLRKNDSGVWEVCTYGY